MDCHSSVLVCRSDIVAVRASLTLSTFCVFCRRCFDVLGFDEYIESHADGLQILRYNITTSYTDHLDYIDADDKLEHDYDSARKGGNRFATILLYMTDLGGKDGGETVFTEAWPTGQATEDRVNIESVRFCFYCLATFVRFPSALIVSRNIAPCNWPTGL